MRTIIFVLLLPLVGSLTTGTIALADQAIRERYEVILKARVGSEVSPLAGKKIRLLVAVIPGRFDIIGALEDWSFKTLKQKTDNFGKATFEFNGLLITGGAPESQPEDRVQRVCVKLEALDSTKYDNCYSPSNGFRFREYSTGPFYNPWVVSEPFNRCSYVESHSFDETTSVFLRSLEITCDNLKKQ